MRPVEQGESELPHATAGDEHSKELTFGVAAIAEGVHAAVKHVSNFTKGRLGPGSFVQDFVFTLQYDKDFILIAVPMRRRPTSGRRGLHKNCETAFRLLA